LTLRYGVKGRRSRAKRTLEAVSKRRDAGREGEGKGQRTAFDHPEPMRLVLQVAAAIEAACALGLMLTCSAL